MSTEIASTTFVVSSVIPHTEPLPSVDYRQAVCEFLKSPVEACTRYHGQLLEAPGTHPLVSAVHRSFSYHYPLVLSPDIVWLTLAQGFAIHVNENAEKLRHLIVSHAGKKRITVRRDDFAKGSPENPWIEVFAEFSAQIKPLIAGVYDLVVGDFSTTGAVEKAAYEVVLMDSIQSYFEYGLLTLCGIPSITLEGTAEDWQSIVKRAESLRQYDLDWWIDPLSDVLEQFAEASQGRVDRPFWESIYEFHGARRSGNPYMTGWLSTLFPYIQRRGDYVCNPYLNYCGKQGPEPSDFPKGPAKAPFVWQHLNKEYSMEFIGGLMGIAQDTHTLALRPEIGWAIRDVSKDNVSKNKISTASGDSTA